MKLTGRYIFLEAFGSGLLVLLVPFAIFMTNQLAEILGDAATERLPREAVLAVFGLTSLRYLTLLMPISVFLGVTLALARLSSDGEIAALWACGVGPPRLLVPVSVFAALLAAILAWLALVRLHAVPDLGPRLVLSLLVLIWVADTAAYFAGRALGRRNLAPMKSRLSVSGTRNSSESVSLHRRRPFPFSSTTYSHPFRLKTNRVGKPSPTPLANTAGTGEWWAAACR